MSKSTDAHPMNDYKATIREIVMRARHGKDYDSVMPKDNPDEVADLEEIKGDAYWEGYASALDIVFADLDWLIDCEIDLAKSNFFDANVDCLENLKKRITGHFKPAAVLSPQTKPQESTKDPMPNTYICDQKHHDKIPCNRCKPKEAKPHFDRETFRKLAPEVAEIIKREEAKPADWTSHLNEPQRESIERLRKAVRGMHNADIRVRKDGQDIWFEADWLKWLFGEATALSPEAKLYKLAKDHPEFEKVLNMDKLKALSDHQDSFKPVPGHPTPNSSMGAEHFVGDGCVDNPKRGDSNVRGKLAEAFKYWRKRIDEVATMNKSFRVIRADDLIADLDKIIQDLEGAEKLNGSEPPHGAGDTPQSEQQPLTKSTDELEQAIRACHYSLPDEDVAKFKQLISHRIVEELKALAEPYYGTKLPIERILNRIKELEK